MSPKNNSLILSKSFSEEEVFVPSKTIEQAPLTNYVKNNIKCFQTIAQHTAGFSLDSSRVREPSRMASEEEEETFDLAKLRRMEEAKNSPNPYF